MNARDAAGGPPPPRLADVDLAALRAGRLARLQEVMRAHGLSACLFFNPANIRYATGTNVMPVWTAGTFERYCLVPADSTPVLFETPLGLHVSRQFVDDLRPARSWQFEGALAISSARGWAAEIASLLKEVGVGGETLGTDRLDTPGFLALQELGIQLADSGPVTVEAREVKTPEEVNLLRANGALGEEVLADLEVAITPGIRECELLARLADGLLRRGGEYLFTRLVASGPNTNPWGTEAGWRQVRDGDLVGVDADLIGYEGYVIDVSRTFLCGTRASPRQREAYKVAHECVTGMSNLLRPGISVREFAEKAPVLPERFRAQRYTEMAHGAGLEDEGPIIHYPDGEEANPDRPLRESMVLCLECYAGEVGAEDGVKLENQVLITSAGVEYLCAPPFVAELLR